MNTLTAGLSIMQNMGLVDRLLRLGLGAAMLGVAFYFVVFTAGSSPWWEAYAMVVAIYPILTGAMGWDPFYALLRVRSCSLDGRNRCGTLPYEFRAMTGRVPEVCEISSEHSLESCHDADVVKPHHKQWRVDQDPMIYPDDADWDEYLKRQRVREEGGRRVSH